jgi:ATP-dependent Lon protease
MSGKITIMGKVLGVGGIQPKLMATIDSRIKLVILSTENESDVSSLPNYINNFLNLSM